MKDEPHFLQPHGNYEELLSYQKALIVYQLLIRKLNSRHLMMWYC